MVAVNPLLGLAVVMLGLLLAVTVGILVSREWYDYDPTLPREPEGFVEAAIGSPVTWTVGFVLGALLLAGTVGYWLVAPPDLQATIETAATGVIALIIAVFTFVGVWEVVRSRGRSSAEAVGVGIIIVGLLFVAGVAAQLLMGG